ncbi:MULTISPECIES: hypothetical protein [unclassified Nitrobacter]|nr:MULTISPECIES: hypothetical protein [unclassified Nitrobacter]
MTAQIEPAEASEVMEVWSLSPNTAIPWRWNPEPNRELQMGNETT